VKDSRIIKKNHLLAQRQSRMIAAQSLKADSTSVHWRAHCQVQKWTTDQLSWVGTHADLSPSQVQQLSGDSLRRIVAPDEVVDAPGNLLTYTGLAFLLSQLTGVTSTATGAQLSNGSLPVGVGDGGGSVPTAVVTDADLTATTNKWYNPVDNSYPTVGSAGAAAGILTIQSTFTGSVANYAWNEWALYGSTAAFATGQGTKPSSATMINHKGTSLGTKASGNIWTLVATIQFS
jgi:hypothetical protein